MILQLCLLLILVFYPSTSAGEKIHRPPITCKEIFTEFDASGDVAQLLKGVGNWKSMLDRTRLLDDAVAATKGEDLKECNGILDTTKVAKEEKNLGKLILADMNAHLKRLLAMEKWKKTQQAGMAKCLANAKAEKTEKMQKIEQMAAMKKSCHAQMKDMEGKNAKNLTLHMAQKNGEIAKLEAVVQQLWEKVHKTGTQTTDQLKEEFDKQLEVQQQLLGKCEKANRVMDKVLYKVQQQRKGLALHLEHTQKIGENLTKQLEEANEMGEGLAKQLEEAQQLHIKEWVKLANAKETWKIATFVLIGVAALLIIAIPLAIFVTRRWKARMVPHI